MYNWPKQKDCDLFYGNPRDPGFVRNHLTYIKAPFLMKYGLSPISSITVNVKCAGAFSAWLETVWDNARHDQKVVGAWGISAFSGSYNYRVKRSGSTLSMHAYGCAIDFDAPNNPFQSQKSHFKDDTDAYKNVVLPFKALGGTWGGDWEHNTDGMHFQFADV